MNPKLVITDCECKQPGWCERHQCHKTRIFWFLCQTNPDRFQMWEQGLGPTFPKQQEYKPLPKCRHRGDEPLEYVECTLCGGRKMQLPVYTCTKFGECTERRYSTRTKRAREMPSCPGCSEYTAVDEVLVE